MLIYIRHSEDDDTDPTYQHDPHLTDRGKKLARHQGKKLIRKYGLPDIIFYSPFRRTRETLNYMLYDLSNKDYDKIETVCELDASRYFSKRDKLNPDVAKSTLSKDIPIYENMSDFSSRINSLSKKLSKLHRRNYVIWCITHTTVYKQLADIYHLDLPNHIPYMHYFAIKRSSK